MRTIVTNRRKKFNLLLATQREERIALFEEMSTDLNLQVKYVAKSLSELNTVIFNNDYDLVVVDDVINSTNTINFFFDNQEKLKEGLPVIFIISEKDSITRTELFDSLAVYFVFEEYLTSQVARLRINSAIQWDQIFQLMKENEFRYKSLFEHSFDINLITNPQFDVIDANILGRSQVVKDLYFNLKELFEDPEEYATFKEQFLKDGQVAKLEMDLLLDKKPVTCIVDAFTLYTASDEVSGYHFIIKDVSKERKALKRASRVSKLESTGKLMRSMAHEVRNPLTNIQLALDQFMDSVKVDEDDQFYFDIIKRSTKRIGNLLTSIIDSYKTTELTVKPESLDDMIVEAIELAKDRAELIGAEIQTDFQCKELVINADRHRLVTAILNLIINAIEAVKEDEGVIMIKTRPSESNCELEITDNGVGMNEEQLKRLFDPFYTGKSKGLGLGLTTTQNIIFAHNGEINVQSTPNEGTTFFVSFPI